MFGVVAYRRKQPNAARVVADDAVPTGNTGDRGRTRGACEAGRTLLLTGLAHTIGGLKSVDLLPGAINLFLGIGKRARDVIELVTDVQKAQLQILLRHASGAVVGLWRISRHTRVNSTLDIFKVLVADEAGEHLGTHRTCALGSTLGTFSFKLLSAENGELRREA